MEAYSVAFSGSVEELLGFCGPAGAEEDVEEGAILCTHRRRIVGQMLLSVEESRKACAT